MVLHGREPGVHGDRAVGGDAELVGAGSGERDARPGVDDRVVPVHVVRPVVDADRGAAGGVFRDGVDGVVERGEDQAGLGATVFLKKITPPIKYRKNAADFPRTESPQARATRH